LNGAIHAMACRHAELPVEVIVSEISAAKLGVLAGQWRSADEAVRHPSWYWNLKCTPRPASRFPADEIRG